MIKRCALSSVSLLGSGLVALSVAVPLIAARLRRDDQPGIRGRITPRSAPPFTIIDDLTTGPSISPEEKQRMVDWYRGVLDGKADSWKPCVEVECPPAEEISISSWQVMITDWLADVVSEEARVIEVACEQALQTGYMGVRVTRNLVEKQNGDWAMIVEAQATPTVPYGQIQGDWGPPFPMGIVGFES